MDVIQAVALLIVGFILLVKGADFFVDGAASIAKILKVPALIVGLTIVAMGTSLPECSVSIIASLNNNNSLAISNAVGSNIFNLMVVCGICALFVPLAVSKETLKRDFPISIACAVLLAILGKTAMKVVRTEGIILLVCFTAFIILMIFSAIQSRKKGLEVEIEGEDIEIIPVWKCIIFIVGGIIAIKFGGDSVVNSSVKLAEMAGVTETVIGLTIVAFGTSLPELVTSIVAAKKNEVDMAVGNVIGSNIFNILMVLGIASTIDTVGFLYENLIDIIVLILFSGIVWVIAWTKGRLNRMHGIMMLVMYAIYTAYILIR